MIETATNPIAHWHTLVHQAQDRTGIRLNEDLESYLAFTLGAQMRRTDLGSRIYGMDLLEALNIDGSRRPEALRSVGDDCLILAGLYPERAQRRLTTIEYFVRLGQSAYSEAASGSRHGLAGLYPDLARHFATLVRVLMALRRSVAAPLLLAVPGDAPRTRRRYC